MLLWQAGVANAEEDDFGELHALARCIVMRSSASMRVETPNFGSLSGAGRLAERRLQPEARTAVVGAAVCDDFGVPRVHDFDGVQH